MYIPQQKIIFIAMLILGTVLVAVFLTWPTYKEFRFVSKDLEYAKKEVEYANEYYTDLENLKARLGQYEAAIRKIKYALPNKLSMPELFNYLQTTIDENGLILVDINASEPTALASRTGVKAVSIALSVKGTYQALESFIATLHENSKIIEVDTISFSSPDESQIFDFKVSVRTHSY